VREFPCHLRRRRPGSEREALPGSSGRWPGAAQAAGRSASYVMAQRIPITKIRATLIPTTRRTDCPTRRTDGPPTRRSTINGPQDRINRRRAPKYAPLDAPIRTSLHFLFRHTNRRPSPLQWGTRGISLSLLPRPLGAPAVLLSSNSCATAEAQARAGGRKAVRERPPHSCASGGRAGWTTYFNRILTRL
jgi:hypothetical protein